MGGNWEMERVRVKIIKLSYAVNYPKTTLVTSLFGYLAGSSNFFMALLLFAAPPFPDHNPILSRTIILVGP